MQFDHAGIVTEDARERAKQYAALFDCDVAHDEQFDGMEVVFLDLGTGYFELLEPLDEEGTIAKYLDKNGPGIHHLAVETPDIESALQRARGLDIELIDETPRAGAWGHDVAFLHPKSTGGVLIEFVEH